MPTRYSYDLVNTDPGLYGANTSQFSASGSSSADKTANWRVHIQNVEVMYTRETQYSTLDGTVDFNYLDCNYTIEATREHMYLNASAGDALQMQTLGLISDSASGALGLSGVIRTTLAGMTRREVIAGDEESVSRITGNLTANKIPGAYDAAYDTSANTNSSVLDILVAAKANCTNFELALVDL